MAGVVSCHKAADTLSATHFKHNFIFKRTCILLYMLGQHKASIPHDVCNLPLGDSLAGWPHNDGDTLWATASMAWYEAPK